MNPRLTFLKALRLPVPMVGRRVDHLSVAQQKCISTFNYWLVPMHSVPSSPILLADLDDEDGEYLQVLIPPEQTSIVIRRYICTRNDELYQDVHLNSLCWEFVIQQGLTGQGVTQNIESVTPLIWVHQREFPEAVVPDGLQGFSIDLVLFNEKWYGLNTEPVPTMFLEGESGIERRYYPSHMSIAVEH